MRLKRRLRRLCGLQLRRLRRLRWLHTVLLRMRVESPHGCQLGSWVRAAACAKMRAHNEYSPTKALRGVA